MLFEDRAINIVAYNLETVLAEKIEAIITRGTANTRMRDFYDVFVLMTTQKHNIDRKTFKMALENTSEKRGSIALISGADLILSEIAVSSSLIDLWNSYQKKFYYAASVSWEDVIISVRYLLELN